MNNKKFRYVCLLTGICVFLASGCNFGSPETDSPAQDTQQNTEPEITEEQVTAEENIPIGAPEESEVGLVAPSIHTEDESPKTPVSNPSKREPVADTKPFWQSENTMHLRDRAHTMIWVQSWDGSAKTANFTHIIQDRQSPQIRW